MALLPKEPSWTDIWGTGHPGRWNLGDMSQIPEAGVGFLFSCLFVFFFLVWVFRCLLCCYRAHSDLSYVCHDVFIEKIEPGKPLPITVSLWSLNASMSPASFLASFLSLAHCVSLAVSRGHFLFLPTQPSLSSPASSVPEPLHLSLISQLLSKFPASPTITSSPLVPSAHILPSCPHRYLAGL